MSGKTLTTYSPVGHCIYCGLSDCKLSDEHVIPFSLGGTLVLPKASCESHAKITSKFEADVARGLFGAYREQNGIATRKSARSYLDDFGTFEAVKANGKKLTLKIPYRELPPWTLKIDFRPPGIILGHEIDQVQPVNLSAKVDEASHLALCRRYNVAELTIYSPTFKVKSFAKTLAKIAHCFCIAELSEKFQSSLLPFILGEPVSETFFVGGYAAERAQRMDELRLGREIIFGTEYLVVEISLRSFPFLPRYRVVAGTSV